MSQINWLVIRAKIRRAMRTINISPIVVRRTVVSGTFDSLTGAMGDDIVSIFNAVGVPISAHSSLAFAIGPGPHGPLTIRADADVIFAADDGYVPQVGDIVTLDGQRIVTRIETYRATPDVVLAYGCKFAEA